MSSTRSSTRFLVLRLPYRIAAAGHGALDINNMGRVDAGSATSRPHLGEEFSPPELERSRRVARS
jgi:hypothetical protein